MIFPSSEINWTYKNDNNNVSEKIENFSTETSIGICEKIVFPLEGSCNFLQWSFFVVFLVKITFHLHLMDIQQFTIIFSDYSILITTNNSNKNYTKTCIPFGRREIVASFEVGVLLRKCICYVHTYKKKYPANNFVAKLTRISLLK